MKVVKNLAIEAGERVLFKLFGVRVVDLNKERKGANCVNRVSDNGGLDELGQGHGQRRPGTDGVGP